MSIDLTERFHRFRQAVRQLGEAPAADDIRALFQALVAYPLPPDAEPVPAGESAGPLFHYRVQPLTPRITALVSTDLPASGTWDHPLTHLDASGVDLRLISFFDWNTAGCRDLQYLRVRIEDSPDPGLKGRDALLEAADCRVDYIG